MTCKCAAIRRKTRALCKGRYQDGCDGRLYKANFLLRQTYYVCFDACIRSHLRGLAALMSANGEDVGLIESGSHGVFRDLNLIHELAGIR